MITAKLKEMENWYEVIGELLTKEKYKFIPGGLLSEIIRDAIKEYWDRFGEPK